MSNVGYTSAAPRSIVDRNMKIDNANYRVFPRPGLCLALARHANQLDIEEVYDLLLSSPLLQLEDVSLIFFFPLDIMNPLFSFLADKILNYVSTSENLNFAGRCDRAAAGVPTGGRRNSFPRTWSKYFVLVISRGFEIMSTFRTVDSMSKYHTQTSLKNL